MKRVFACTLSATLLAGCFTPKLTRHYAGIAEAPVTPVPFAGMEEPLTLSVFPANPKVDADPPLIDRLGDKGQAELIRSVASRMPDGSDAGALLRALGEAPADEPAACAWADRTLLKKRVTLTVLGRFRHPADRIDRLEFTFKLSEGQGYEFASWDKFDTVYGTHNLGSAKFTQAAALGLGLTGTSTRNLADAAGSIVKTPNVTGELSSTLEETMTYAMRRMNVGGSLEKTRATLVQEGAPYINLLGSSSAVFTLRLASSGDPMPVHAFDFKQNMATAPDDVGVVRCQARHSRSDQPLTMTVEATAVNRLVEGRHRTVSEGDDVIRFTSESFAAPRLDIVDSDEMRVNYFGLWHCPGGSDAAACRRLAIENPDTGAVTDEIAVKTPEQAAALRQWLVTQSRKTVPASIGTRKIGLIRAGPSDAKKSGTSLNASVIRELQVKLANTNKETSH